MERRSLFLAVAAGLWLAAAGGTAARADIYRWTDEKGTLHFTSDPSQVPARYRDQVVKTAEKPKPPVDFSTDYSPARERNHERFETMREHRRLRNASNPKRRRNYSDEEKPKRPTRSPYKYIRDCSRRNNNGACASWVNPEWKRWKQKQKQSDD